MATALSLTRDQIITAALRRLRVVASGSSGTANEVSDAAISLNALVKELEHDPAIAFNIGTAWTSVAITAAANSVTLAAGELTALAAYYKNTATGAIQEMTPVSFEQLMAANNNDDVTDSVPKFFWCTKLDTAANTMFVSPAPSANGTIYYIPKNKIDLFDSASDSGNLPDAWGHYLIRALTAALAWEFGKSLEEIQAHEGLASQSYAKLIAWEAQAIQQLLSTKPATNRE